MEENETLLLRQEVITAVLDGYYEKRDGLFYELADTFSVGRDDGRIAQMVQLLYDFTRSHPFPDRWLSETARSYSTAAPVEKTPWGKTVLNFAGQAVDYCCSLVKNSLELMEASPDIQAAYEEAYLSDLAGLLDIEKAIEAENWNLLVELCGDFFYKRLKSLKGAKEDPVRLAVAANRDEVKATLKRLGVLFCGTETACREDLRRLSPLVEKLFEVVRTYSARLDEEKAKKKAADFGDLEHWALRLLVKDTAQGLSLIHISTIGVAAVSRMELIQSLCLLISRGALISMVVILIVLPALLILCAPVIKHTTFHWIQKKERVQS